MCFLFQAFFKIHVIFLKVYSISVERENMWKLYQNTST